MNRRGFLSALATAAGAVAAAPLLSLIPPPSNVGIAFRVSPFLTTEEFRARYLVPAVAQLCAEIDRHAADTILLRQAIWTVNAAGDTLVPFICADLKT